MDDQTMIAELRKRAESKAMTQVLMADMGVDFQSLVPPGFADKLPNLGQELKNKEELLYGSLALSADLIEGTYTGDPIDPAKLAAMLRKSAEEEDDFAWRQDSEADDKKAEEELRELGMWDEDENEDDGESEEDLREYAETARETAKFYRDVADRIEKPAFSS